MFYHRIYFSIYHTKIQIPYIIQKLKKTYLHDYVLQKIKEFCNLIGCDLLTIFFQKPECYQMSGVKRLTQTSLLFLDQLQLELYTKISMNFKNTHLGLLLLLNFLLKNLVLSLLCIHSYLHSCKKSQKKAKKAPPAKWGKVYLINCLFLFIRLANEFFCNVGHDI